MFPYQVSSGPLGSYPNLPNGDLRSVFVPWVGQSAELVKWSSFQYVFQVPVTLMKEPL